MTSHIAFDLGLRCTGIAWDGGSDLYVSPNYLHKSPMTPEREHARYTWWRELYRNLILSHPGDVVVEAPILHPKHATGSIPLIVLHGVLRSVAIGECRQVSTVQPATLKKWATGKGNATKEQMVDAARLRGWEGSDHNEADAWLIWTMHAGQVAA
jgi:Holliday junction resolvasome RuvABC endonuclease subunit